MSNPYEKGYQPYQPQQNPYGSEQHDEGLRPSGGAGSGTSTDGLSIAAFVCSLTCCAAPVGVGLGIAGLVRTKDGKRRGRWAAITGLVLGIIGTLLLVAGLLGVVWVGVNTVPLDEARVGECVDTGEIFDETDLWKADCDEPHDGEIIAVDEFDGGLVDEHQSKSIEDFCAGLQLKEEYADLVEDDDYTVGFASEGIEDEPEPGNLFVCYLARADGGKLDAPLLG